MVLPGLRVAVEGSVSLTHGRSMTPEYRAWIQMNRRCHDPHSSWFQNYGARGIIVCDAWRHDFTAFFAHVGLRPSSKHSLDRIDVNGHYESGNVRWATAHVQMLNRRDGVGLFDIDDQPVSAKDVAHWLAMPRSSFLLALRRSLLGKRKKPHPFGEGHPIAKLTSAQAVSIRELALAGHRPTALAHRFGVARGTITSVLAGRTWTAPCR